MRIHPTGVSIPQCFSILTLMLAAHAPVSGALTPTPEAAPQPGWTNPMDRPGQTQRTPVLAMLDFQSQTLPVGEVMALSHALWSRVHENGGVALLPRDGTRNYLLGIDQHPLSPYARHIPEKHVLNLLNADYLVMGSVDRVDRRYILEISCYAAPEGRVLFFRTALSRGDMNEMVDAMQAVSRFVTRNLQRHQAMLRGELLPPSDVQLSRSAEPAAAARADRAMATAATPAAAATAQPRHEAPETKPDLITDTPPAVTLKPVETQTAATEPAEQAAEAPVRTVRGEMARPEETAPLETAAPHETAALDGQTSPAKTTSGIPADTAMQASRQFELAMQMDRRSAARLAALREAVRLDPAQANYQRSLAMEYYLHGDYPSSIDQAGQALRIDPDNADLMTLAGSAYFELTHYDQALEILDRAVAAEPKNLYATYNRALTLEALGSPEARDAWAAYVALAEASQDPRHHELVSQARQNLERLSE